MQKRLFHSWICQKKSFPKKSEGRKYENWCGILTSTPPPPPHILWNFLKVTTNKDYFCKFKIFAHIVELFEAEYLKVTTNNDYIANSKFLYNVGLFEDENWKIKTEKRLFQGVLLFWRRWGSKGRYGLLQKQVLQSQFFCGTNKKKRF